MTNVKKGIKGFVSIPSEDRFWSRVIVLGADQCWEWTGIHTKHGYGQIHINNKIKRAHRYSWELHFGREVPDGLCVCHRCDNPKCVNPHHLFIGTQEENMKDSSAKGRVYKGGAGIPWNRNITHCKHGHEFTEENTSFCQGRRRCKECSRIRDKAYRGRRDAALAVEREKIAEYVDRNLMSCREYADKIREMK